MIKKCVGCGAILQTIDETKEGFAIHEGKYCFRCFRLKHYHEMSFDNLSISNEEILKEINQLHFHVYYFVDLINLSAESLLWFKKIKGTKHLIFTKCDLIPHSISFQKLKKRMQEIYQIKEDILFLSVKRDKILTTFIHFLENQKDKKVLFCGMTNVGKSSFLNELSTNLCGEGIPSVISEMPNTTLNFMEWKMKNFQVIDAPGFNYKDSDSGLLLKSVPKKYFKPINMQMKEETILIFDDFVSFKQNLEKNSFTFYGSNLLKLEKKYKSQEEFIWIKEIDIPANSDVVFPGIGFLAIKKACHLIIQSRKAIFYEVRDSLLGGNYDCD